MGRDINTMDKRRDLRQHHEAASKISLRPYTEGAYSTRSRVTAYYRDIRSHIKTPHRFLAYLSAAFAPSTALTYALTAQAHIPELANDKKTKEAILFLKKEANRHEMKKATPITPLEMKKIADLPPSRTKHTVMLMWITAARHADLRAGKLVKSFGGENQWKVAYIRFGPWKSDPTGSAQASKTVPVSPELLQMLQQEDYVNFSRTNAFLKSINPSLTPHSIRRGAIAYLARHHPPETIAMLTQHAAGQAKGGAQKYMPPSMYGPLPSTQLRLASALWDSVL